MAEHLHLSKPSLQLQVYCGTQLRIGAEITLHLQAGECQAKCVALVQEDTPVELLLGTNLMPQLGVQVLDNKGHTLLYSLPMEENEGPQSVEQEECLAFKEPLAAKATNPSESSECTTSQSNQKNGQKLPASCQSVSGSRHQRASAPANPKPSQGGHRKILVRLVRACKLPARSGKLLQARAQQINSSSPQIFEPKASLCNSTVDIANSLILPSSKGQLFLPVYNFAEAPTWLRRG